MDNIIPEKYRFELLDNNNNLTDENIRNFLNASYNLYIDFSNAIYPEAWFSKNPQWMKEVLKIQTQGWHTHNTKYYKFLKFLFIEIHNFYFIKPPDIKTNFLYENTANKLKFLHQLLQTLEEDNITGVYRVPIDSNLTKYLRCNVKRLEIFDYFVPENKAKYLAISNTQIQSFIELKQKNQDFGQQRKCEEYGIYEDLPKPSYPPRPSHKKYDTARKTKRGFSTDARQSNPNQIRKTTATNLGGKTKKQRKKKLSKKKLFKKKRINKTRKKY